MLLPDGSRAAARFMRAVFVLPVTTTEVFNLPDDKTIRRGPAYALR